ncbi:Calcineurin responsive transcriptional factor [Mycena sanguinolenta]|uniref:Calcineurin responsive transcriptional factor n=1 Tax=Mycena sanguinolenta TaxID=230812 RepID=A0A8H6ZBI3_9AGAR|nr:Calcineurin responsive transcriptional factor [Mycena sanguinolenta]
MHHLVDGSSTLDIYGGTGGNDGGGDVQSGGGGIGLGPSFGGAQLESQTHALNIFSVGPASGSAGLDNGFLSLIAGLPIEDISSGSILFPPDSDLIWNSNQFLSPTELPPSIDVANYPRRTLRWLAMERDVHDAAVPIPQSQGVSSPHYPSLPVVSDRTPPPFVPNQNVMVVRTAKAGIICRRSAAVTFICPIPGCGSTFTRSFHLKGHIRTHTSNPFLYTCKWPACGKGFARQHDCNRHEQLHANYSPFTCGGCNKQFARMHALERHLRSERGAECQRTLEANGRHIARGARRRCQR